MAHVARAIRTVAVVTGNENIMLAHVLREYNVNKIFLSRLGLWPFQSKLVRNSLPMLCLIFEISYYPFEVMCIDQY